VTDRLGAQGTVLGGGRYDGLIETLGGPHTPAVGWAAGIERLGMMVDLPKVSASVIGIAVAKDLSSVEAQVLATLLRGCGYVIDTVFGGKEDKQFNRLRSRAGSGLILKLAKSDIEGGYRELRFVRPVVGSQQAFIDEGKIRELLRRGQNMVEVSEEGLSDRVFLKCPLKI
jgi:histidyl-tRNA synthetase